MPIAPPGTTAAWATVEAAAVGAIVGLLRSQSNLADSTYLGRVRLGREVRRAAFSIAPLRASVSTMTRFRRLVASRTPIRLNANLKPESWLRSRTISFSTSTTGRSLEHFQPVSLIERERHPTKGPESLNRVPSNRGWSAT